MHPNPNLTQGMYDAHEGSKEGAILFYREFLQGPLYIPRREQDHPMSDQPEYPNELLDLLGLKAKERTIVPAFTAPELIEQWCGLALRWREISGEDLFSLIPEEWWVTVNPGLEIEKELSPWELEQLRGGVANIPALVEELFSEDAFHAFNVTPVSPDEHPELCKVLQDKAPTISAIRRISVLREERIVDEGIVVALVVGIEVSKADEQAVRRIHDDLRNAIDIAQIGGLPVRLKVGISGEDSLLLGAFRNSATIYEATDSSLFSKVFGKKPAKK